MEKAATSLRSLLDEVEGLREKVSYFERERLAEDIALMQAAEGVISYEDLLDERDRMVSSGEDLSAVKLAMQRYGPGKTTVRTVVLENDRPTSQNNKEAKASEPDHLVRARLELEEAFSALQG